MVYHKSGIVEKITVAARVKSASVIGTFVGMNGKSASATASEIAASEVCKRRSIVRSERRH